MDLNPRDQALLAELCRGLPLVPRPFAAIGEACGLSEAEVLARLQQLMTDGVIRRFGIIVRHRALGYRANAMVVFDVPEAEVQEAARRLCALPEITLCYRRPRRPPVWPYNLFCMIHGRDRARVEELVVSAAQAAGIAHLPRAVLFSGQCFVQRGARYGKPRSTAVRELA